LIRWTSASGYASIAATPATIVIRLPLKVPDCQSGAGRWGLNCSITAARPPNAPTGKPPPMILAKVVRSGRTR
jgi:hypothetical protein